MGWWIIYSARWSVLQRMGYARRCSPHHDSESTKSAINSEERFNSIYDTTWVYGLTSECNSSNTTTPTPIHPKTERRYPAMPTGAKIFKTPLLPLKNRILLFQNRPLWYCSKGEICKTKIIKKEHSSISIHPRKKYQ